MIGPDEVRAKALKYWKSGRVLRAWMGEESLFPLTISTGRPTARTLLQEFPRVRAWKSEIESSGRCTLGEGYRIEYSEHNHRQLGAQRLPREVVFDAPIDLVSFIGKQAELRRFAELARELRRRQPALSTWIPRHPLRVLEHASDWPRLLAVLEFFQAHPRPMRYLRELDIPGVDSKFVERRKAPLAELLDAVLPAEAVDASVTGSARHGFERRYGLRYDEPLLRLRLLDPALAAHYGGLTDLSLPLSQLAGLDPPCGRVFITENKVNGLSFPPLPESLVVFGLGYGVASLGEVPWLRRRQVFYWGDLDTHGFAILSQLRGYLPGARSLLMDRETLERFRAGWVEEEPAKRYLGELDHLTEEEAAVFHLLRDDRLGERVRLEQERLPFVYVNARLSEVLR